MKFTEFYAMKGEDGRTILKIVTLDGDDMMFEEVKENKEYTKIPYVPPPRFQQPRKTPEDSTESKILKKHKLNQNFLHLTKAKAMILMRDS